MVPISSRNSVPRSAISNKPFLRGDGAGERALDVPEQRGFQQVGRHRAGIDRNKGAIAPRRVQVNGFGDQFFAGPALALQKNGGAAGRHLRHQVENLQHGLALAHDVFKVVALLQRALELNVFLFRAMAGHGGANIGQQLLVVPGLLDEVGGPGLHRLHRIFHCAVGGDHDDRQLRDREREVPPADRCHCGRAAPGRAAPGRKGRSPMRVRPSSAVAADCTS